MLRRPARIRHTSRAAAGLGAFLVTATVASSALASGPGGQTALATRGGTVVSIRAGHRTPFVIAHRGASRYAPENTLAAVDAAHARGLVWVENDVQRTKDGRLIVMHDTTLNRTTDAAKVFPHRAPWRVRDFTAAEIARLDAGRWFGKRFAGTRVPTLDAYLRRLDRNHQGLLLELKAPEQYPGIEAQTLRELRAHGWLDRAHLRGRLVIQSFCVRCVRRVHTLMPRVRTGILGRPPLSRLRRYARFADQINPRMSEVSSRWARAVHRLRGAHGRRLEIYAWDVGTDASVRAVRARAVEGVID
ncbi:glycerophosphodiester phosphodiesterase [Streptomyces sp. NRRL F-4489]|uniref:glycerophosphodiester phosphodiesterase n=1 Tax=Streptomyces sp. NRRL F-4489 TaxID=1609095 RepID=UPI00074AC8E7|nr:glycerophosphodiester phosphodiesterase family protein [Streptomyces sp. NRRL F-4489]KUL55262.1 glycerophosphodiester phosphodiesterase [Streptomyces sp. NRRL F-4489]